MSKLSLRHVVGIYLLAYAAAFAARPDIGSVRYVADSFQLNAAAITLLYAAFGVILLVLRVTPPLIVILSLPLLIFAVAGFIHARGDPLTSWVACVGYLVPFAQIVYSAFQLARRGDNGAS